MIGSIANNRFLRRVNPQITRALADSGSSLEHSEIQQLMRQMVDLNIADNLKLWVHSGLVKTRTSGSDTFVPKAYDISGEDNDGVQATEANQPKLVSDGMEFDNTKSLSCGNINITNNLTVLLWTKTISGNNIMTKYDVGINNRVWQIFASTSQLRYEFRVSSNGVINSNTHKHYLMSVADPTTWGFVGFTFNSNSLIPYYNGSAPSVTKSDDYTVNSLLNSSVHVMINSALNNGTPSTLAGQINRDIRIFNTALSATEITAIYNATKSKYGH